MSGSKIWNHLFFQGFLDIQEKRFLDKVQPDCEVMKDVSTLVELAGEDNGIS